MASFHPVPVDRPPPRSWLPALGSILAIAVALAIVKPWDGTAAPGPVAIADPSSTAAPVPTEQPVRNAYDPRLFGGREPDPAWELWPAGYVVQFGMAGPVGVEGQDGPAASGDPAPAKSPAGASTAPSAMPAPSNPIDPFVVDLGPTDHLIALGINTPLEVDVVEVRLWRQRGTECCDETVPIVRLPTLWESQHFLVIGIVEPGRPGETGLWPPGEYRLDLVTLGAEVRSVRLRVSPPVN